MLTYNFAQQKKSGGSVGIEPWTTLTSEYIYSFSHTDISLTGISVWKYNVHMLHYRARISNAFMVQWNTLDYNVGKHLVHVK